MEPHHSNDTSTGAGPSFVEVYACSTCHKTFNRKDNLHRHIKQVHENIKPFQCTTCGKSFTTKNNLQTHFKTHPQLHSFQALPHNSFNEPSSLDIAGTKRPVNRTPSYSPKNRRLERREVDEKSLIESLPEELRELYTIHWESIKTHTRHGTVVTTVTVFWDPMRPMPDWDEVLMSEFNLLTKRFKINFSHALILQHRDTEEFSFFHASANNHTVLENSKLISNKKDFLNFLDSIRDLDILDHMKELRPSSKFVVVCIPSTSFYFYHLNDFPMGCLRGEVPAFLKNNKWLYTLQRSPKHGIAYTDNLCFFRCLALHKGASLEALEGEAKYLFSRWKRINNVPSGFKGVRMDELGNLERFFRVNIDVYEFRELDSDSPVLTPIRRSDYDYDNTVKILGYEQHFMYIIDIDKLGCALKCQKCEKLWKGSWNLDRHQKSCTGLGTKMRYQGGLFKPTSSVVQDIRRCGFVIEENFVYPYRATFDFEVYFDETNLPRGTKQTQYKAQHIPLSVSIASNVDGFEKPVCFVSEGDPSQLVDKMVEYLLKIADKASEILHETFAELIKSMSRLRKLQSDIKEHDNTPISEVMVKFETYISTLPVVGFNSGRYDINVIKPYLIKHLLIRDFNSEGGVSAEAEDDSSDDEDEEKRVLQKDPFVVKRNNQYLCIGTNRLRFLDIINYLAPGFSYQKYLTAFKVQEQKSFFPYEYVTSLEVLKETQLPPHEAFYSTLKKTNITEDEYKLCHEIWRKNNMKTMKDFLIFYNNKDVGPFLTALQRQIDIYKDLGIDLLKDGLSVPGITLKYMFQTIPEGCFFSLFHDSEKDLHTLLRDNITGGPSLIFHRYHAKDETFIRNNPDKPCKSVRGYDANALYLSAIMKDMPTGFPTIRRKCNGFRAERRHWYGQQCREWLEYEAHLRGITIEHEFNVGERQMGRRKIKVDGYDKQNQTVYQFHGCMWHGHKCQITEGFTHNPYNGKRLSDLYTATAKITEYLRDVVKMKVVEMRECDWQRLKRISLRIRDFVHEHVTPHPSLKIQTEEDIIQSIQDGRLFGLVECDITTPSDLEDYFSELQPIFKNTNVGIDDIGEHMKEYALKHKLLNRPRRTLVGSYFGKKILLASPLIKWYLEHGLKVDNITLVLEYDPKPCFLQFGQEVTRARREGDSNPSEAILADTYKLLGNSAYGKTLTNISKHRDVKFVDEQKAVELANEIGHRSSEELGDGVVEVSLNKKCVKWNLPLQIGFFVYQYAKLRILQFHYDFIDKYVSREDYQLLEMDTDSLYLALSASSIEALVRPALREDFFNEWDAWFPARACLKHKQSFKETGIAGRHWDPSHCLRCQGQEKFEQRTPGLFKTEYCGDGFIGLCSKTYYCFCDGGKDKFSCKGLNRVSLSKEHYEDVLKSKKSGTGVNQGFKTDGKTVFTYTQQRDALSYMYIKRVVESDGVTTRPIRV